MNCINTKSSNNQEFKKVLKISQPFFHFRHKAIDDLSSFTTFYKRAADNNARYRRQALEDLGAFTTFMKKDNKQLTSLRSNSKRSTRSISREALRDALGTFSSFMNPHQYYKRVRVLVFQMKTNTKFDWKKIVHEMFCFSIYMAFSHKVKSFILLSTVSKISNYRQSLICL